MDTCQHAPSQVRAILLCRPLHFWSPFARGVIKVLCMVDAAQGVRWQEIRVQTIEVLDMALIISGETLKQNEILRVMKKNIEQNKILRVMKKNIIKKSLDIFARLGNSLPCAPSVTSAVTRPEFPCSVRSDVRASMLTQRRNSLPSVTSSRTRPTRGAGSKTQSGCPHPARPCHR